MTRLTVWLAMGLVVVIVPELLAAERGGGIFQWQPFLGPFHSILLHFPIGFVTMAFLVDLFYLWRPKANVQPVITLMLSLSVATTVLTIVLGMLRASGAEYDPQTLAAHKNYGIAVGVLTVVTLVLQWLGYREADGDAPRPLLRGGYRVLLLGNIALLVIAGHEGGNLTHGSNYLTKNAPEFVKAMVEEEPVAATASDAAGGNEQEKFYLEKVKPIFDTKCLNCHGPEKQKGKYRMDQPAIALKGGDSDKLAVKPGDPFASNLVRLILLPPADDDVMPPTGKGSLTPDEVMHVIRWIQQGAHISGHKAEDVKPAAEKPAAPEK
ncbi:MAG: Leucine-rich repeat ribonuclease inhibitor subtype [Limisphaerales bacterium]|nr:MAG: Leucine-rich repeat ribonuclease inhibitor subtype [Limisphaerales bacterium]KAG0507222.1 MAG: Leucine-rich repeat ribonuclease inhibitor subtype [Limisphaerales bacterium]TXT47456.1 MAG: Leucine-rich repeat ribonuclease inhibitor subtype [Limisphaerales bacterium]